MARMPVSIEFSMARRKLVSDTSAACICSLRRMWRQVPSSIQTVSGKGYVPAVARLGRWRWSGTMSTPT